MPSVSTPDSAASTAATPARRWLVLRPWIIGLGVALIGGLLFEALYKLLRQVRYADVLAAMHATPAHDLILAIVATALSYWALAGYDLSGLRYAGARVRPATVGITSFIAYALGNTIGLGVLTGGTVRMRMYTAAGIEASQVAQAVAFNAGAFGLGMTTFGAAGVLWGAHRLGRYLPVPVWAMQLLAVLVLMGVAAFMVLCMVKRSIALFGRWHLPLPEAGLALRQLAISAADLGAAAAALWFLLPDGVVELPTFVAFYTIAMALGVISHVPGGLGVFEAVILIACGRHAPVDAITAALLLYRAIYFLLPLILAAILLAGFELRAAPLGRAAAPLARAASKLTPGMLAAFTAVAGVMLLISGVTPATDDAAELLSLHVPLFLVEASHLLGSVAGLALLLLARGLLHRLDAAWWASLLLTTLAAILALPKGIAISEALVLGLLVMLLIISRRQFDRPSSLFMQTFETGWLMAVACVVAACAWLLFFVYRDVDYADRLWWQFAFDAHAPRSMRALMAVSILALGLGLWQLFRQPAGEAAQPTTEEMDNALAIIRKQPAADACLALTGDKSFLFSPSGETFIMYGKQGRSWVALGDPVGKPQEWAELIWRFIEMADAHGGRAAFYKARPQTLPLYLDAGLHAWKLGEEAYVPLHDFSLQGPRRAKLRHGVNRGEREGLRFEILTPEQIAAHLPVLQDISNAWLAEHETREKSFSLGAFDPAYLLRQPVAIVRQLPSAHAERTEPAGSTASTVSQADAGRIVAFATLMCPDVQRIEASVDLMRQLPDAPQGTMDFLFARMMQYFQSQGYQRFGLGMAPMSGMVEHELAPRWHRFGRWMFQYGERFYNFRGLRSFKDKFDPIWEARYLVSPGGVAPLFTLIDTAALIGGGLKGVIAK